MLHLERALEQVDTALSTANASKKPKKQDPEQLKVCQYLEKLEILASEKGETGLAISLSKPFQRLLKYPLLFKNLYILRGLPCEFRRPVVAYFALPCNSGNELVLELVAATSGNDVVPVR